MIVFLFIFLNSLKTRTLQPGQNIERSIISKLARNKSNISCCSNSAERLMCRVPFRLSATSFLFFVVLFNRGGPCESISVLSSSAYSPSGSLGQTLRPSSSSSSPVVFACAADHRPRDQSGRPEEPHVFLDRCYFLAFCPRRAEDHLKR